jgi:enterochelin esterase family protein
MGAATTRFLPPFGDCPAETVGSAGWWRRTARRGTPRMTDDGEGSVRLDFLWRDPAGDERTSSVRRVYLDVASVTDHSGPAPFSLERLPRTDVWFGSLRVEADWRGSYCFIPTGGDNPPPDCSDPAARRNWWRKIIDHAEADPLNHHPSHPSLTGYPRSPIHLPRSPSQAAWREVDSGRAVTPTAARLRRITWNSARLGNRRRVWIFAPDGGGRFPENRPLVVLLDGGYWAEAMPVFSALGHATRTGEVPSCVYVLVDALDRRTRVRELPCNPLFWDALDKELLPSVAGLAAFSADRRRAAVAGQSFGGLAALFAALHRPERFGRVLCQSGSLWWPHLHEARVPDWLSTLLSHPAASSARLDVLLEAGSRERVIGPASRRAAQVLSQAGHRVRLRSFSGGHDPICWRGGLVEGLAVLLSAGRPHTQETKA